MNPRKLAEEARHLVMTGYPKDVGGRLLEPVAADMIDALIAQADLLEKYRKTHEDSEGFACVEVNGNDYSCDLCRAYDAMMKD